MTRWLWIVIGLVVIGLGTIYVVTPKGVPVDVGIVQRGLIREFIEEQAKTRLPDVHEIAMPLEGRILPITLEEGDRIEEGQVVARMDVRNLETTLIERSNTAKSYEKNLQQLEIAIEQAEQTVKAQQAKYDFAERVFSRTRSLAEKNSVSIEELEEDELQMTESAIELRKEQLNKNIYVLMRGVIELMWETDVAKQAQAERDRDRAVIRSPVAGVVLSKEISNERVLAAGSVLLTVGDPEQLQVEADMLTQDVVKIQRGDAVDIEGPAIGPKPVAGRVAKVYPQGFTKISSLGVEQQRVTVVIDFDSSVLSQLAQRGSTLGVDYRVRVKVYTDRKENALVIPRAALFRNAGGNWQVFAVSQGRAVRTDVEIGLRNDSQVEIVGGLAEGDQVILAPDSSLTSGTLIEPQLLVEP